MPRTRTPTRSTGGWSETYPAIEARAAREGAEIHWCDETGAAADEQPRKGYARKGHPAWIEVPDPHIRMNLIATITNEGEVHFLTYEESMTAALFITFLEKLLSETTRKVFLILDRLPAHETKAVADWVAAHGDRIELFWLPKSAPELNAEEYLNNDLKGSINAAGLPSNKEDLRSRMERFMSRLLGAPGARSELLPPSVCSVCRWYMILDHFTCQGNTFRHPREYCCITSGKR